MSAKMKPGFYKFLRFDFVAVQLKLSGKLGRLLVSNPKKGQIDFDGPLLLLHPFLYAPRLDLNRVQGAVDGIH